MTEYIYSIQLLIIDESVRVKPKTKLKIYKPNWMFGHWPTLIHARFTLEGSKNKLNLKVRVINI